MHGRVFLATLAAALLLAAPARADLPAGNLVSNPGAEAAPGAQDSSAQAAPPGWTLSGPFTAVAYGAPSFPTAEDGARLAGGANFFAGGPDGDVNTASQVIDVSAGAPEIDRGGVVATLSALLGGYASQDDGATVSAEPLDAAGAALAAPTTLPAALSAEREGLSDLLRRTASVAIPAGTRSVRITITATRTAGQYNDGYADNISFSFGGSPVAGQSVGAQAVAGTVLVKVGGKFVPLAPGLLKNGAEIDARKGRVEITRADGGKATFYDGIFKLSQAGGITTLTLSEKLDCSRRALTAAKPKTRKLWGDGKGRFRTKGTYSAATVRGTRWLVQDTCTSTRTSVRQGSVTVRDVVAKRNVVVRTGKSYTARAKRR